MKRQIHFYISTFIFCSIFCSISLKAQELPIDTTKAINLDEVIFIDKKIYNSDKIVLSTNDFKKIAGSFDDPSRVLLRYPGFSNVNDQANGIIYHGLPSHFFTWQMNELDIVNPNHLSNAGTLTDVSSTSSGGVNMFSGNVLNKYSFYTALNQNKKLGVIGGASDLKIEEIDHSFFQLSLLGLETGLKYKFNEKHTVYANYRYSFTGLLNNLGVKFGDEKISFEDLIIGYNFKSKKSRTSLLFAQGNSKNQHDSIMGKPILSIKDPLDISYNSDISLFQIRHENNVSENVKMTLSASYSKKFDDRVSIGYIAIPAQRYVTEDLFSTKDAKLCLIQDFAFKSNISFGLKEIGDQQDYETQTLTTDKKLTTYKRVIWIPYFNNSYKLNDNIGAKIQLSAFVSGSIIPTPSAEIYYAKDASTIKVSAGLSAQKFENSLLRDVTASQANNYSIEHKYSGRHINTSTQVFYHDISKLPSNQSYYNVINGVENNRLDDVSFGQARSKGVSFLVEYYGGKDFWLNVNQTVYDLKYKNFGKNIWVNAENNFKYTGSFSFGKDFNIRKNKLSISSSYYMRGGQYYFDVSNNTHLKLKSYDSPPSYRLQPYTRFDLRINYKKEKALISLDIQNITNHENDAYPYYDLDGLRVRKQLGMIPVLTYRRRI
jgi:hypothetical protein